MQLTTLAQNGAVTGVFPHAQSAANKPDGDDAEQAIVTGPTRAGDFALTPGVVGAAGPEFGTDR